MTRLALDHLSYTYPNAARSALDQLSLTIAPGTLTALLGPSGCGKTTAMKLIAGLLAPTSGDITVDGQSIRTLLPEKRGTVMVFQNHLLFPFMTLAENVGFGLKMRGTPAPEIAARVGEMLERVHLAGLGARRPADLSGGQQQRAALARALILKPRVLLLDEPLSNLDAHLRGEMRALIQSLQRETGITTLFVTHDQEEAVVMADRIALILDGRLAQEGVPTAFYNRPANIAVARFFGGVNFLVGEIRAGQFHSALGPVNIPEGAADGPGTLTIRPEAIQFGPSQGNSRKARLTGRAFLGTLTRLHLLVGDTPLQALVAPAQAATLPDGAEITVSFPADALWVLPAQTPASGV
jgi:ABC-type Fe3+/spermidine/putrescine transport system ATPase subunit